MNKYKGRHKMNKHWQAAADQITSLIPGGAEQAADGVQKMFDAIADAGADPAARLDAALAVFADNTNTLRFAIGATGSSPVEGCAMAKALLKHTLDHIDEIESSVLHGHST